MLNTQNVQVAFIGEIPEVLFKRLKAVGVLGPDYADAKAEHAVFQAGFLAACRAPDAAQPPVIPAWRQFTRYDVPDDTAAYFLHPFASETAFPPTKKLFGSVREAALECCDVRVDTQGAIKAVAIDANPLAVIHHDGAALCIKPITADAGVMALCFTSTGARVSLTAQVGTPKELTPFFREARARAGALVARLLQRPSYFPAA